MERGLLDIGKLSSLECIKFEICVWDAWVAWRIECKSFSFFWVWVGHLYCTVNDEISDANTVRMNKSSHIRSSS
jgi:hypothetical protein